MLEVLTALPIRDQACVLLGCDDVQFGRYVTVLWRNLMATILGYKKRDF